MAASYVRILSDEAVSAGIKNAQPSVVIGTGMQRLVRIKFTNQGRLTDFAIRQSDGGTSVAFVAEILTTGKAFPPDTDQATSTAPAFDIGKYRVLPQIVGVAGEESTLDDDNIGYNFRNVDGGYTDQQRYLYVLIVPTGAAAPTSWDIKLETEYDVQ